MNERILNLALGYLVICYTKINKNFSLHNITLTTFPKRFFRKNRGEILVHIPLPFRLTLIRDVIIYVLKQKEVTPTTATSF